MAKNNEKNEQNESLATLLHIQARKIPRSNNNILGTQAGDSDPPLTFQSNNITLNRSLYGTAFKFITRYFWLSVLLPRSAP